MKVFAIDISDCDLAEFGSVDKKFRKLFDIDAEVFYADINWTGVLKCLDTRPTTYEPLPKYPEVRRDLSMILERAVQFEDIRKTALKTEKNILKEYRYF